MNVTVRKVTSLADCDTARRIAAEVWGHDAACSTPQMSVHANYGGVVLLAEEEGRAVGFLFSFPARYRGEWVLWSHETAVLPEYLHQGIGLKMKLFQRKVAHKLGYGRIVWTYDPLVARNAHFNFNKLGAQVVEYKINAYGADDSDLVNRGIETDRFVAVWDVAPTAVGDDTGAGALMTIRPSEADRNMPLGGPVGLETALTVGEDGCPVIAAFIKGAGHSKEPLIGGDDTGAAYTALETVESYAGHTSVITQIPLDGSDTHELRVDWRAAFRRVALDLFASGLRPTSFSRQGTTGEYIWQRVPGPVFERGLGDENP